MSLKTKIKSIPALKQLVLWMIQNPYRPRPRAWVKWFWNPFVHTKLKGAFVSKNTRMDVFPFHPFFMAENSTIEDFSCVNNALGRVLLGKKSRIGIGNTVIGPVKIGANVNMAQNIVLSGLNHGYKDISLPPREQACTTNEIVIGDDCWIGANVVVTSGVQIGNHCVVAAGSVVTKDVPPFSVVVGNPGRVIKQYDFDRQEWVKK